jgi:flagellar biosynthetic protein FliP
MKAIPRRRSTPVPLFVVVAVASVMAAAGRADDAAVNRAAVVLGGAAPVTVESPVVAAPEPPVVPVSAEPGRAAAGDTPLSALLPAAGFEGRSLAALWPTALVFGAATLAPAVLLMTTCFVRISVVLGLVRQGLGAAGVPGNQVVASLAIFLSALVMWPVWTQAWDEGLAPYQAGTLDAPAAFERGSLPIRRWMAAQIEQAGNRDTMLLFLERHPAGPKQAATYDDVPLEALLPAFLVSELETAFAIGFRLLLPFLVLDILVATLAAATGLVMLPPTLVSLPLKLLVFVAADGWTLVIRGLLDGFAVG